MAAYARSAEYILLRCNELRVRRYPTAWRHGRDSPEAFAWYHIWDRDIASERIVDLRWYSPTTLYVGSTGNIWKRWNEQKGIIKHTEGIWPAANDYKYRYLRKYFTIEELHYKILARFDDYIEDQCLKLLEGIFTILFSVMYCYPDGKVPTTRQSAVKLMNNIQFTYRICSPI